MSDSQRPTGHSSRTPRAEGTDGARAGGAASSRQASRSRAQAAPRRNVLARTLNYPRARRRNPWRWLPSWRMILGAAALVVLAVCGMAAYLYATTDIPEAQDVAVAQTTRVYFSDGKTEMGTFSDVNRTIVPSDQIPDSVRKAVVASEDSTFYENRGVSPKGILRALINNVMGGARQGGSTITQQYVERYYTGTNTSYLGKAREMVMAVKIDQEQSKEQILDNYLNTIYFGRGAYGIQAAAKAYFDKDAKDLTDGEAALLVAVIPAPSAYDPAVNPKAAQKRWNRVITREVTETKVLTETQANAIEMPSAVKPHVKNKLGGTNGYLARAAEKELLSSGFTQDEIETGGFTIVTTIDKHIQDNTVQAVKNLPHDRPENNHVGTVTIDPRTGAVRAMYGGVDYVKQARNDATQSHMQAGSIFKTFTLVAALQEGYSLNSSWDGNSPQQFPGWRVKNFNNASYGTIDLKQATTDSVNTAYAELNLEMGPQHTREAAVELGLPATTPGLDDLPSNVLGSASPTVMNMASAYATIASQGTQRSPHVIDKVLNPDGTTRYSHKDTARQVLDKDVAINATVALQGPPSEGSGRYVGQHMDGRPVAGKTGTSESFRSAWFVGFTPQLVTAVGMFQPSTDGKVEEQLTPFGGEDQITGGTFPSQVWVDIMRPSLKGQEQLDFPEAVSTRKKKRERTSSETTQQDGSSSADSGSGTSEAPSSQESSTSAAPSSAPATTAAPTTAAATTKAPAETTAQAHTTEAKRTTEPQRTAEPTRKQPTTPAATKATAPRETKAAKATPKPSATGGN